MRSDLENGLLGNGVRDLQKQNSGWRRTILSFVLSWSIYCLGSIRRTYARQSIEGSPRRGRRTTQSPIWRGLTLFSAFVREMILFPASMSYFESCVLSVGKCFGMKVIVVFVLGYG